MVEKRMPSVYNWLPPHMEGLRQQGAIIITSVSSTFESLGQMLSNVGNRLNNPTT